MSGARTPPALAIAPAAALAVLLLAPLVAAAADAPPSGRLPSQGLSLDTSSWSVTWKFMPRYVLVEHAATPGQPAYASLVIGAQSGDDWSEAFSLHNNLFTTDQLATSYTRLVTDGFSIAVAYDDGQQTLMTVPTPSGSLTPQPDLGGAPGLAVRLPADAETIVRVEVNAYWSRAAASATNFTGAASPYPSPGPAWTSGQSPWIWPLTVAVADAVASGAPARPATAPAGIAANPANVAPAAAAADQGQGPGTLAYEAAIAAMMAMFALFAALAGIALDADASPAAADAEDEEEDEEGLPPPSRDGSGVTAPPPQEHWTVPLPPAPPVAAAPPDGDGLPPPRLKPATPGDDGKKPEPPAAGAETADDQHWTTPQPAPAAPPPPDPADGGLPPPAPPTVKLAPPPEHWTTPQPSDATAAGEPPAAPAGAETADDQHWTTPQPAPAAPPPPDPADGGLPPPAPPTVKLAPPPEHWTAPQPPPEEHWTAPQPSDATAAGDPPAAPAGKADDIPRTMERAGTGTPRTEEPAAPVDPVSPEQAAALHAELARAQDNVSAAQAAYDANPDKGWDQPTTVRLASAKMELDLAQSHQIDTDGRRGPQASLSDDDIQARHVQPDVAAERTAVDSLPPDQRELASRGVVMAGQGDQTPADPALAPQGEGQWAQQMLDKIADIDRKIPLASSKLEIDQLNAAKANTLLRLQVYRDSNYDTEALNRFDNNQNFAVAAQGVQKIVDLGAQATVTEIGKATTTVQSPGEISQGAQAEIARAHVQQQIDAGPGPVSRAWDAVTNFVKGGNPSPDEPSAPASEPAAPAVAPEPAPAAPAREGPAPATAAQPAAAPPPPEAAPGGPPPAATPGGPPPAAIVRNEYGEAILSFKDPTPAEQAASIEVRNLNIDKQLGTGVSPAYHGDYARPLADVRADDIAALKAKGPEFWDAIKDPQQKAYLQQLRDTPNPGLQIDKSMGPSFQPAGPGRALNDQLGGLVQNRPAPVDPKSPTVDVPSPGTPTAAIPHSGPGQTEVLDTPHTGPGQTQVLQGAPGSTQAISNPPRTGPGTTQVLPAGEPRGAVPSPGSGPTGTTRSN